MSDIVFFGLFGLLLTISGFFAYKLYFALSKFRVNGEPQLPSSESELPTVSVCVPARNEVHAMTACLERLLATSYPKIEIIVLDDSSGDKTPVLIKSFAHSGVRFVEGSKLPEGWLGKNHALEELSKEASGKYILYMDVDTLVDPDTVGRLVAYLHSKSADMVSVLPRRVDGWRASVLFAPLRYFRELILHSKNTPAVASSIWMINKNVLQKTLGGFTVCKEYVQPEAYFAQKLMQINRYRFLLGNAKLGVNYEKKWKSQIETGIRLTHPVFGAKLSSSILVLLATIAIASPAFVLLSAVWAGIGALQVLAGAQLAVFVILYGVFLSRVWTKGWWLGMLLWPIVIVQECVIIWLSLYRYKTGKVTWKGRPIRAQRLVR